MKPRSWPSPLGRILQAALGRVSLHHLAYQANHRGYVLRDDDENELDTPPFDTFEFEEAAARFRRGEIAEALIWLERALPDIFAGLSTAAVPAGAGQR